MNDINEPRDFVIVDNIIKGIEQPYGSKYGNIGKELLECFRKNPNHIAQIDADTGKQTTFAEMEDKSIRCALWLQQQGIGEGDVVTICTHNHLDAYIPCVATFLIGAIYNPWHHEDSIKIMRHLINITSPKVIFVCESALKVVEESFKLEKEIVKIIVFGAALGLESLNDILEARPEKEVQDFESPPISNLKGTAIILHSSGTTGPPKGVVYSHETFLKIALTHLIVPGSNNKFLWYSTLFWITGTLLMIRSIMESSTRILHADFKPDEMCIIIERYQVDRIFISPPVVSLLSKSKVFTRYKCESLKLLMTGGERMTREILQDLQNSLPHALVINSYGMTETGGTIAASLEGSRRIESVGFLVANMKLKIIDLKDGKALESGQEGEICVRTPKLMTCYYKNPTATQDIFDREGWLHTGDKGYYDENGEVFVVDRLKEIMRIRGHQVSPFEIEELLITHPAVMLTAVVPIPHEVDGDYPMAFVKKCDGLEVTEEELIKLSAELGENRKLWGGVTFVDQIPQTASGKVDRKTLKEMAKEMARAKSS
ncbi:hypothetical protein QAD02_017604 [Eretmocerus hayati]|uniref:Uncharacterized protein n=1 Tax=Eretmocerus hayati TaxID=131215 RepID=A0ACC2PEC9_9HYME|nr:hypothetical protein QAD02_017604 [Eretmocerus hayati]